jgi:hypothetical protein
MTLYKVWVDDNFHYQDTNERYALGVFETLDDAVNACKKIVDEFLDRGYKPGKPADELFADYKGFGEDPFLETIDGPRERFSAWTYAEKRCHELCDKT